MTSHQNVDLSVWKDLDGWGEALSSAGAQVRNTDINSPVCTTYDEVLYRSTKRWRE